VILLTIAMKLCMWKVGRFYIRGTIEVEKPEFSERIRMLALDCMRLLEGRVSFSEIISIRICSFKNIEIIA
jgi:hypothetical protein